MARPKGIAGHAGPRDYSIPGRPNPAPRKTQTSLTPLTRELKRIGSSAGVAKGERLSLGGREPELQPFSRKYGT